jgi:hypothetical protein
VDHYEIQFRGRSHCHRTLRTKGYNFASMISWIELCDTHNILCSLAGSSFVPILCTSGHSAAEKAFKFFTAHLSKIEPK